MPTAHQLLSDNTREATSIFRDSLQLFLSYPDKTQFTRLYLRNPFGAQFLNSKPAH